MPIKKPEQEQVYNFIAQSHMVEKLPCTILDVMNTAQTKNKNWYADGHLRAFSTAINKVITSTDFPTRYPHLTNIYQSNESLHWLKNLHTLMLEPIARNPANIFNALSQEQLMTANVETPQMAYLGIWRPQPAGNLMGAAPPAQLIQPIMHNWLVQLKTINDKIKDHVDNPYGINKAQYREMLNFVTEQPAFFSSVQPFKDANNRFGRLIENVIRIAWRLPFRWDIMEGYDQFKENLETYQTVKLPQIIKEARELKA
jgi:hypothetical protein